MSSPYDVTVVAALFRSMKIKMSCWIQNMIKYELLLKIYYYMYLLPIDYGESIPSNLQQHPRFFLKENSYDISSYFDHVKKLPLQWREPDNSCLLR